MLSVKDKIKKILYTSSILPFYNRIRNKKQLTVVVYHRVLEKSDYRWRQADKEWSVSTKFFTDSLMFYKKHYNPVTLEEVINAHINNEILPNNSILITFDDGWKDNYDYAYPIVKECGVPITIFCTTGAINKAYLNWREVIYAITLLSPKNIKLFYEILTKHNISTNDIRTPHDIINKMSKSIHKNKMINEVNDLTSMLGDEPQMLSEQEIIEMSKDPLISFGTHGHSHEPLASVIDAKNELLESKLILSKLINKDIETLAYPHSSTDQNIYNDARNIGYHYQFGGRVQLNNIDSKQKDLFFGRVHVNECDLCDSNGELAPELMSLLLFRVEHENACF